MSSGQERKAYGFVPLEERKLIEYITELLKTPRIVDSMGNEFLFGMVKSLIQLNYFCRMRMEVLVRDNINLFQNFAIWSRLEKCSDPNVKIFAAVHGPKHCRTIGRIEKVYSRGERFYSGLILAKNMIRSIEGASSYRKPPGFPEKGEGHVFRPTIWSAIPDSGLLIAKILLYVRESCEVNNPKALELYIQYLQNDLNDYASARIQIRKLLELGETRTDIDAKEYNFCFASDGELRDFKKATTIVGEAVEMYSVVEKRIIAGKIERENEIFEYNPDAVRLGEVGYELVVCQFDYHKLIFAELIKKVLDRHLAKAIPILKVHCDNPLVSGVISYAIGTHCLYNRNVQVYSVKNIRDRFNYIFSAAKTGYYPALEYLIKSDSVIKDKFLEVLRLMPPSL